MEEHFAEFKIGNTLLLSCLSSPASEGVEKHENVRYALGVSLWGCGSNVPVNCDDVEQA